MHIELDFLFTVQQVAVMFVLILIGYIAGKSKLVSVKGQQDFSQLILYVTLPITLFNSLQIQASKDQYLTALSIMGGILIGSLIAIVIGYLTRPLFATSSLDQQNVIRSSFLLYNASFMGYPILMALFGSEVLFYAVIGTNILFEFFVWTLGRQWMSRTTDESAPFSVKKILLAPGIVATILGLTFSLGQIPVVEPFSTAFDMISPATSPLAMILVGLILSRSDLKKTLTQPLLYKISFIKLLVVPLVLLMVLKIIGVQGLALAIPVLQLGMPSAAYLVMFATNYDNESELASGIVFLTSLLSILTIPLLTLFM